MSEPITARPTFIPPVGLPVHLEHGVVGNLLIANINQGQGAVAGAALESILATDRIVRLNDLAGSAIARPEILHIDVTLHEVLDDLAKTAVLSFVVPSAKITSDSLLHFFACGHIFNNTGGNSAGQWSFDLGATEFYRDSHRTLGHSTTERSWWWHVWMAMQGDTTTERMWVYSSIYGGTAASGVGNMGTDEGDQDSLVSSGDAAVTEDLSSDKTFTFYQDYGTATSTQWLRSRMFMVELFDL